MDKEKKDLRHNTIALMVIQLLNYILPFVTLPYISRILTVSDYGTIFFAQAFIDYFGRFIMFGFDLSAVRQISIRNCSKRQVNHIFNSVFTAQIILLIIGFIVLNIIIIAIPKLAKDRLIYYYTYLGLIGTLLMFNWFYQGIAKMKFITILNIINRLVFVFLIFYFIKTNDDYILYPLINSISMLIAGFISIAFIIKNFHISLYIPKLISIIKTIKYSSQFFLTKVSIAVYRSANSIILGLFCTSTSVAYFVAADKIYWSILALYLTFINALFPYMSKNKDKNFFLKILTPLTIFAIIAFVFLFFGAKYIILVFYSEKYLTSVTLLQLMSIAFVFYFFVDTLGFPFLGAFGYLKETNQCYIIGGIYNILGILILVLLQKISVYSITALVVTTYVIMFIHRIYYIKKYNLLKGDE